MSERETVVEPPWAADCCPCVERLRTVLPLPSRSVGVRGCAGQGGHHPIGQPGRQVQHRGREGQSGGDGAGQSRGGRGADAAHVCPPATPRGGFHHPAGAAQVRLVPRRSCLPASDAAWGVSPSRRSSASASRPSPLMSARQRRRTGGFTIPPEQRKCVSSLRLVRHSLCWPCGHTHAVEGSPSSARVSSCGCAARGCVARVCPSNPRLG
jgi:hypothetical protein